MLEIENSANKIYELGNIAIERKQIQWTEWQSIDYDRDTNTNAKNFDFSKWNEELFASTLHKHKRNHKHGHIHHR